MLQGRYLLKPVSYSIALCCLLSACNDTTIDKAIDDALAGLDGKTKVQIANVSASPLAFHMASFTDSGKAPVIHEQKHRVALLNINQPPLMIDVRRSYSDDRLVIQAFDHAAAKSSEYLQYKSALETPLQVLAWSHQNQLKLAVLPWQSSRINGVFRLRIFATQDATTIQHGSARFVLKAGELTDWLSVQRCVNELVLNAVQLDICQATQGLSYIAVVDDKAIVSLIQQ
jgi:hypothetical protein